MRRIGVLIFGVFVAAAVAWLLGAGSGPAKAAFPGHNGRIVLSRCPTGYCQLFTVKPDGSSPKQLTATTSGYDYSPAYSAKGGRIVYIHEDASGNTDIYSISATGGTPKQITNTAVDEYDPALSPNGKRIAYDASDGTNEEIYTIPAGGGTPTKITDNNQRNYDPVYSPNGKRIAYDGYDGTTYQVYTVSASGGTPQQVTNGTNDEYPSWSPNGKRIAYQGRDASNNNQIYTISSTGGVPKQITNNTNGNYEPAYSPDGKKITYYGYDSNNNAQIYVVSSGGGVPRQITSTTAGNYDPDWQPNFPPSVTNLSPKPGKSLLDRTPTIAASVRDGQQHLSRKNIGLRLDGNKVTGFSYDSTTGKLKFTPRRNLSVGTHHVTVGARDEFKLTGSRSWSFKISR